VSLVKRSAFAAGLSSMQDPTRSSGLALDPLLTERFSPACFDRSQEISATHVELLLEAARWAPSAGNSQPWGFIVGRRGDPNHTRLVAHLAGSSASWAPDAALLVANLSHVHVEGTDWDFSEFSHYDVGQAVAHMTLQAQSMGLFVRQFRAFDRAAIADEFDVPSHWEVTTMSAFGVPCGNRPTTVPRERRSARSLIWS
jgi:nitroreductase